MHYQILHTFNSTRSISQIGHTHGKEAKVEIDRGLLFYQDSFQKAAGLSWSEVCDTAAKFEPLLRREWKGYCGEMEGMLGRFRRSLRISR